MSAARRYDVIVIGAGHNGLTSAAFLAKAGLRVLVLERNTWIGGAAVSRSLHENWLYSNCSYVSSLLRPEIFRGLELAKHGLQIVPYGGGVTFTRDGDLLGGYIDKDVKRREIARFSARDADAWMRYSRDTMRQCRFIRSMLLRTPPDPASFKPRDLRELLHLGREFGKLGEQTIYDTIRFYTLSIADYLSEYFEHDVVKANFAGSGIIGTALGVHSPGTASRSKPWPDLTLRASFSASSMSMPLRASSTRESTSPIPRMREAMRSGWKGSRPASFSPTPANLIGAPVTWRTDRAAPPRESPSSLVRTTPVSGRASAKALAVLTAS